MKMKLIAGTLLLLALSSAVFGMTYKSRYQASCSDLWAAVKDTLGNPDNARTWSTINLRCHERRLLRRRDG